MYEIVKPEDVRPDTDFENNIEHDIVVALAWLAVPAGLIAGIVAMLYWVGVIS